MRFMSLLTIGEAFTGFKDRHGVYRLPSKKRLPTFGGSRGAKPLAGAAFSRALASPKDQAPLSGWVQSGRIAPPRLTFEEVPASAHGAGGVVPVTTEVGDAKAQAGRSLPASLIPREAVSQKNDPPSLPASPPSPPASCVSPSFASRWTDWFKSLWGRRANGRARPAASFQPELALEKVTVVRNDLNDESAGAVSAQL
jgi:hypothetical protein